jgi:tRNA-dihydrouridine synthase
MSLNKFYLAPFQGVTDAAFRNAFVKEFGGIESAYAPYIAATGPDKVNPNKIADVMPRANTAKVVPQVLSKDAAEIINIAKTLENLGYTELNWNLGCPFPKVADKKRGSGLIPFPDEVQRILDDVIPYLQLKLSIKTRLGYDADNEVFPLLEKFNQYPISHVIIHARTAVQQYAGNVNPKAFSACQGVSDHALWYNGDVFSLADYDKFREVLPDVNHYMIGRGALMNPELPGLLMRRSLPSDAERRQRLNAFLDGLEYGLYIARKEHGAIINRLKMIWMYLSFSFKERTRAIRLIRKCTEMDTYQMACRELLANWELDTQRVLKGYSNETDEGLNEIQG